MYRLLVADDEMIERAVLVQLLEEELGDQCRIFQTEKKRLPAGDGPFQQTLIEEPSAAP